MNPFLIALFIVCMAYCQASQHIEARLVGIVTEVKLLSEDDQKTVNIWVRADDHDYILIGHNEIPRIYVKDTLFEYWVDYRKLGVGTRKNLVIYDIKDDPSRPW